MICYSMELNDQIIVKCYGFLSCAKKVGKNIGIKIRKT